MRMKTPYAQKAAYRQVTARGILQEVLSESHDHFNETSRIFLSFSIAYGKLKRILQSKVKTYRKKYETEKQKRQKSRNTHTQMAFI